MTSHRQTCRWSIKTATVPGASHERAGTPNQDAVDHCPWSGAESAVALAVSDGHGSPHCFRSDVGARTAVDVAVRLLSVFLESWGQRPLDEIDREAQTHLIENLTRHWALDVERHRQKHPFSNEEEQLLRSKVYPGGSNAALKSGAASLAYGATLLAVAVGNGFAIFFQLGDGEFLIVPEAPGPAEPAMAQDPMLIANETTSLCMPDAKRFFRYRFLETAAAPPRLILASTDGYPNCFKGEADFQKVGTDLRDGIRRDGFAAIGDALQGWLRQASAEGSGDDATLGLIWREDDIAPEPGAPAAIVETVATDVAPADRGASS